ncbi:uncharacterized protein RHO17_003907 [Thomomys bottae]
MHTSPGSPEEEHVLSPGSEGRGLPAILEGAWSCPPFWKGRGTARHFRRGVALSAILEGACHYPPFSKKGRGTTHHFTRGVVLPTILERLRATTRHFRRGRCTTRHFRRCVAIPAILEGACHYPPFSKKGEVSLPAILEETCAVSRHFRIEASSYPAILEGGVPLLRHFGREMSDFPPLQKGSKLLPRHFGREVGHYPAILEVRRAATQPFWKDIMADHAGENSEKPKRELKPVKGIMGPPPTPKRRYTKAVMSKILLGEEESKLEIKAKGEGAAFSQESRKQPMEKNEGSSEALLKKSTPSELKEIAGGSAEPSPLGAVCEDSTGSKPSGNTVGEFKRIEFFTGQETFLQLLQEVEYMKGRVKFAEHTISEAIKELVAYEASKNSARPENEMFPMSVAMDLPPLPKHQLAGERGFSLETTNDGKGKGVNDGQDDHEQPKEKDADDV